MKNLARYTHHMKTQYWIIMLICLISSSASAQKLLSLEEAIQIALEENYSIKVAHNEVSIAENNFHPGRAGLLPTLDVSGNYQYSKNNTTQQFVGQEPNEITGAINTSYGSSIDLGYTLFDGLGNINNYKKLKSTLALVDAQTRANIELTIMDVITAYYALARAQENYRIASEALEISEERLQRESGQIQFGQSTRRNYLNVKVNYNTDSAALVTARLSLETARNDLVFLLAGNVSDIVVSTTADLGERLDYNVLKESSLANNSQIVAGQYDKLNAEYDVKLANAVQMPRVSANASYGYDKVNNDAGFLISNQTNGLTAGVTVGFNIFDGRNKQIDRQNAKIALDNQHIRYEELLKQTERNFNNAFASYENNITLLSIEENSLITAQQNFETTQEQNRFGTVTSTEFREAQLNLINAQFRITDAKFIAKVAEFEVLRMAGLLLDSI